MKEYIISRAHDADIKFVGEELFSAIDPFSASLYRTKAGNYVAVRILASSLMSDQDLAKQVEIVMENHPPGTKKTKAFSKEAAKKLIEFFGMSDFAMDLYNKINLDAGTLVSIVKSKSKSRLMVFSVYKSQFIGYICTKYSINPENIPEDFDIKNDPLNTKISFYDNEKDLVDKLGYSSLMKSVYNEAKINHFLIIE
jgi:predicted LPLAT superfamily acyltransferase